MPLLTRRRLLAGASVAGAYGAGIGLAGRFRTAFAAPEPLGIEAAATKAGIIDGKPTREMMTFRAAGIGDGTIPPVLRLKRGQPFAARLTNRLEEPTTIHWHGLRIPNAMDGVPFLTQPYVYTGDNFDYAFTPPDAGTFWYHPHCNTLTQMGRGMAGMLIVEDDKDPVFDAEIDLNLRDFRLGGNGQFIAQFKPRDAAKSGTFGTIRTANWRQEPVYDAPAGGLVRLRIAVTDVTRIYNLKLDGAQAVIAALDSQALPAHEAFDLATVSPGQRLDLIVRMPDDEGATVTLSDIRPSTPKIVASLRSVGRSLDRALGDAPLLAPNAPVELDLSSAEEVPLLLSATAEDAARESFCGSLGFSFWAINKKPWPGDTADPTAPLAEMKLGRTYVLDLENVTPHAHPIHLHGMNFVPLASSTRPVRKLATDTYLVLPDEKVKLALVADNPGDWVIHCHIIEHQKTGMTSYLRVV
ncbi:multicopper oxidase family protein [Rhizobium halophytocola]|uniref:FtsP/CotA-like multicopper oxidase with cupredoxin domain n=1 Tax=Rhizobium halophytocola TaxID=735519 RepID=A0ABS4DYD6_9HYPH|nr:multicopper oxidase family protein [Rhizobium halophytocola]MBP1850704.1 FtsP/CotA-like multicopper oxidase with cupredoxin domain [Rhizobium halophytocola]